MTTTALSVVGKDTGELTPSRLVEMLAPRDKATIMSLCMPTGANDSMLAMYLYRCKEQGFDPLSGELVLQKWTNNDGSVKLSFITTRDALLKKAEINPNYMGLNSGVVREGDTFLVDTEKSVVTHTFGTKRGKILAGWAVVYHKTRLSVIAVVDFDEYSNANSKSPVWKSLPSAMIQKVAEVAALRRQFPILAQGVYTAEEMQAEERPAPVTVTVVEPEPSATPASALNVRVEETHSSTSESPSEPVEEPEVHFLEKTSKSPSEPVQKAAQTVQATEEAPVAVEQMEVEAEAQDQNTYKCLDLKAVKSAVGTPVAKIMCEKGGKKFVLMAKGEAGLAEAGKLHPGCLFQVTETLEEAGFTLVKTIKLAS